MIDLWLTVYGDSPSPLQDPAFLLNEFEEQRRASVRVSHMVFEEAWPKLLNFALHGGGPHISLIGAIWTSTLYSMNVLRPFSEAEINSLGGASAFFPATWDNALGSENNAWSIPFNVFTYLILYRKDLLSKAGVAETAAFSSPQALIETIRRLKSSRALKAAGAVSPLVLPSGKPFPARTHLLASWIWGAGGNFISDDEHSLLFTEPVAIQGMADFFSLYRLQSPADCGLSAAETIERFAKGEAAVIMAGANSRQVIQQFNRPEVLENIGVAPLPGVPWVGGSNLVLWKEVRMNMEQERAALDLARFLTTPRAQVKLATAQFSIPARVEALSQLAFAIPAYRAAVEQSVRFGRSYPRVRLWVRIMNELRGVFDLITADVLESPDVEIPQILQRRLKPLANRLNLMLS
jgi:multiple sugar transport system substrate-binding protein